MWWKRQRLSSGCSTPIWCQENGCYPEGMKNFKQGLQAFAQVVRKRPKQGGEKTTVLLGYRLISEFDPTLLA